MIDFFVQLLLLLNKALFNNLGLTIIFIGVISRAVFHPFLASSLRYTKAMRDLKPRLDEAKTKHGGDMRRLAAEQSRLFREAGINPASGAFSCFGFIIQAGVFILLFQSLNKIIASGVETHFLFWELDKPDTWQIKGLEIALPGVLVILTAILTFVQSKMLLPPSTSKPAPGKRGEDKGGFSEALVASQSQMAYLTPLLILVIGVRFASGLSLYWLVSTFFGIIQQYAISGAGGLNLWLLKSPTKK
ncbi:MAG: hypothetical protein A2113_01705 [Candidatus Woykebacteria bacterium GWA1_44_8]|uniref:Membrane insertase YidC/Oxa/ALB C-terminal domain-containing protein n=1 Tax=Candidatus Woykebacteria bacterium GWA1_44_8 TaxID=1802591 RepID=A0A1G1W4A4_9BACT|nr:MAG: hypothetical protein A2113_01705 [Candidatus Woykebacteria bacterium GWA1_44_8]